MSDILVAGVFLSTTAEVELFKVGTPTSRSAVVRRRIDGLLTIKDLWRTAMICMTQAIENDAGAVVYLGCYKVMSESKVYDWENDGLPPHVKKRALKILKKASKCYKGLSS